MKIQIRFLRFGYPNYKYFDIAIESKESKPKCHNQWHLMKGMNYRVSWWVFINNNKTKTGHVWFCNTGSHVAF